MKRIAILGSTGSIGTSTLDVVRHLGASQVQVEVLAAHSNIDLLEKQAREFTPQLICVYDEDRANQLRQRLPRVNIMHGIEGLKACAAFSEASLVVCAMTGTLGIIPVMHAIQAGKDIALANKEALVSGGSLVIEAAKRAGSAIFPVDSEHSAIFQCLQGNKKNQVKRLILTASGGPFRNHTKEQLANVTLEEALAHPTWKMGKKITVDSSTLFNKGLEVIEAHWLFGIPLDDIHVVVHPQSIVHSMVEYVDGSIIAQMSEPSMKLPIQFAITYPQRQTGSLASFDFTKTHHLDFYPPDINKFPCLKLAYDALREGGSMPCFLNAANEVLVTRFLNGELEWQAISRLLSTLMDEHKTQAITSLDDILFVDRQAREQGRFVNC